MRRSAGIFVLVSLMASGCAVAEEFGPAAEAHWGLTPDTVLTRETTEFVALVTETGCASGRSSEGRIVGPQIEYTDDSVIVRFGVRPLDGGQDCPGNPATRVAVALREPLGERRLVDGGSDPPREAPLCLGREFCE